MSQKGWLVMDVGTHAVRAGIVDGDGRLHHLVRQGVSLHRLDEQKVEQNPEEISQALERVVAQVLANNTLDLKGAGLACQRSTMVAWRREDGVALSPALSWQDTRGAEIVDKVRHLQPEIRARSGLVLSPHYGASKLALLQKRYGGSAGLCVSPLVSFLLYHLLKDRPCVCDEGNAGRTQLWHLDERRWDSRLVEIFGIAAHLLPEVRPTISNYGELRQAPVPLLAVAGDQNAALCGVLAPTQDDRLLANLGSGAFALRFAGGGDAPDRLLRGLAFSRPQQACKIWEGTVNGAGLALSWFAQQPEVQGRGDESWLLSMLPQWLDDSSLLAGKQAVIFHNSVGGLGSPFWCASSEVGFEPPSAAIPQKSVALVESIAFLLSINILCLRDAKPGIKGLCLTGGLARLDGLCQRLANLQQLPVTRLAETEATLLGCARLASDWTLPLSATADQQFDPKPDPELVARFRQFEFWALEQAGRENQ